MPEWVNSTKSTRISDVLVRVHRRPYETEYRNPLVSFPEKNAVLVFVITEGGVVGVGESWCDGGAPDSVVRLIETDLAPLARGSEVTSPEPLWQKLMATETMSLKGGALYAAVSGLDIAVWDAYARTLRMPLHRLLGGQSSSVPAYASGGLYAPGYSPEQLGDDMAIAIEQGYLGVKMKVAGATLEEDKKRVRSVRQAIGPDHQLMVDALFSPSVSEAIRLGGALSSFDLHFFEAPTRRRDIEGWKRIHKQTGIPLSGPEVESELYWFHQFLDSGAVQYLQADACICGGITQLREIAALAARFSCPMTYHASGSAVALAANAQVAAAESGTHSLELHMLHQSLFEKLWDSGWRVANGRLELPDHLGLGIEIRPEDCETTMQ